MAIKTIHVVVSGSKNEIEALLFSEKIADKLSAKLGCLYPSVEYEQLARYAFGVGRVSTEIYEDFKKSFEYDHLEKLRRAENLFEKNIKYKNSNFIHEVGHINEVVSYYGKYSDLMCVSLGIKEDEEYLNLIQSMIFETNTPIILIPQYIKPKTIGKILIAWDGSIRSSKAVKSSIDILKAAKEVLVVGVNESEKDISSANQLIEYLKCHKIKAKHLGIKKANFSIGKTILEEVEKQGCDLLIMGAYTHNKIRQVILGGVTKYMLAHTKIPVLMQH